MPIPTTTFYEFDSGGESPSGYRHNDGHASFIKILNTDPSGALAFGSLNIDSAAESSTKVMVFRVSDMQANNVVENMKFWAPNLPSVAGSLSYNAKLQPFWVKDASMTAASGQVLVTLPGSQNLYRCNAGDIGGVSYNEHWPALSGTDDANVSEYIYLNVSAASDVTPGKYGAGGDGAWIYRVTFDYY